jgi:cytochrome c oxidase subunit 2
MKQIPAPFWTLTVGVLVTLISFWVGNHHGLLPEQASAQAALVDDFFNVMIIIGTALFLVVEGAIVYSLIQFRRRKGDDSDGLPIEGNLPLEAFWTAIPAVIVIGLGVYSVQVFQDMGGFSPGDLDNPRETMMLAQAPTDMPMSGLVPEGEEASAMLAKSVYGFGAPLDREGQSADLEVDVSGMQYAWIFTYPNSGIVDGELHVPIGADVQLNISAKDVIHSFWVPQFRLKQDAIPGQRHGVEVRGDEARQLSRRLCRAMWRLPRGHAHPGDRPHAGGISSLGGPTGGPRPNSSDGGGRRPVLWDHRPKAPPRCLPQTTWPPMVKPWAWTIT